jgi:hypothetical protein
MNKDIVLSNKDSLMVLEVSVARWANGDVHRITMLRLLINKR